MQTTSGHLMSGDAMRLSGRIGRPFLRAAITFLVVAGLAQPTVAQNASLPGSFAVSPEGAATYKIPISAPPGSAGMSPSLSLEYGSRTDNGIVGVSWTLAGLPLIGRCPRTMAQDGVVGGVNFDVNDRFCLEGQRLIATSGTYGAPETEYRTEIESFSRVISHDWAGTGPVSFEVRTKSGLVMEFGSTVDSRVVVQGRPEVRSWAVNKVTDSKGNYYSISYVNDYANGQAYPSRIDYTGNSSAGLQPYNSVRFVYSGRSDIAPALYQAGAMMRTTQLLTNIQTYIGQTLLLDYRLSYGLSASTQRSRLTSVTLCAADNSCLPPVSFGWQEVATSLSPAWSPQTGADWISWQYAQLISGDFNGDGLTDIAVINPNQGGIGTYLSNGNGSFAAVWSPQTGTDWASWSEYSNLDSSSFTYGNATAGITALPRPIAGDFNGDGLSDFAVLNHDQGGIGTYLSNGGGTFRGVWSPQTGTDWASWTNAKPVGGEFNGDGLTDIAVFNSGQGGIGTYLSNGDGTFRAVWSPQTGTDWGSWANAKPVGGEFNGDGLTDIAVFNPGQGGVGTYLSNGDGTFRGVWSPQSGTDWGSWSAPNFAGGDFNGDGLTDIAVFNPGQGGVGTYLSNGDGTFRGVWSPQTGTDWGSWATPKPVGGEFNGDGLTDIAVFNANQGGIGTYLSNGDGTFRPIWFAQPGSDWGSWSSPKIAAGVFDHNGLTDIAVGATSLGGIGTYIAGNGVVAPPDRVVSIATGLGATTQITYLPITKTEVYTRSNIATYPEIELSGPLYVVSRIDISNGVGGMNAATYKYTDARTNVRGRGFLGFRQMKATDLQTGVVETTNYLQSFPYIGMVASTMRSMGTQVLGQATSTFQLSNAANGTTVSTPSVTSAPYRVSLGQRVETQADLDGSAMPSTMSSFQYDAFGNATQVAVSNADGYGKTTSNTYTNDATSWLLGRLTTSSVTATAP